jgi:glycosyltransferase involved in cell wall biosynthesis
MNHPLVSIIIPTYNNGDFIIETLQSVLNQSYTNIEVIVVDDGSTDQTAQLFNQHQFKNTNYFKVENNGASAARNYGINKARGSYIQFLDADDVLEPNKIELQITEMLKTKSALSFSFWDTFQFKIPKNETFIFKHINVSKLTNGKSILTSFGLEEWFIPLFSWIIHIDLIKTVGLWNEDIGNNDDGEFFTRVLLHTDNCCNVPEILGHYRILESNSLSKLNTINKVNSAFESCLIIENYLKKENDLRLLAYPKRLYYIQYKIINALFPKEAKRVAKQFDSLKADCFLKKKKRLWLLVQWFGITRGEYLDYICIRILHRIGFNK